MMFCVMFEIKLVKKNVGYFCSITSDVDWW
jgi:hypothetical protein